MDIKHQSWNVLLLSNLSVCVKVTYISILWLLRLGPYWLWRETPFTRFLIVAKGDLTSSYPSVYIQELGCHSKHFREILQWRYLLNLVKIIEVWLQHGKISGTLHEGLCTRFIVDCHKREIILISVAKMLMLLSQFAAVVTQGKRLGRYVL